jgi:hypothetical protein
MMPDEKNTLGLIEKVGFVLYTAFALGSLLFWDKDIFLGVLVGGAFALVNFKVLRLIASRVFQDPENPRPGYFVLLVPKFTSIGLFLWICVKYEFFDIVAFAAGTLSLFLAIAWVAVVQGPVRPFRPTELTAANADDADNGKKS